MNKLYYTIGLPGSGKSYLAKQMVAESKGQLKLVEKDMLRLMIDSGKWSREREKTIIKTRDTLIKLWLSQGFDVICSDTNFGKHEESFKLIVEEINVKLERLDFTDVDPTTCIKRDLQRENPVGERTISDMYFRYIFDKEAWTKPIKEPASNAVLIDLDGTLAINNGRGHYDASKYGEDLFNYHLWHMIKDQNIIFLSGREGNAEARKNTINWLKKYTKIESDDFYMSRLLMRKEGDNRPDWLIKGEIYDEQISPHYNIICVYDDRTQVVTKTWRARGLFTCQVSYGDF